MTQSPYKEYQEDLTLCKEIADEILKNAGPRGRLIDVDQTLKELWEDEKSYHRRPWEEDAFFTGYLAGNYYDGSTPLRPDEWTAGYPDKPVEST